MSGQRVLIVEDDMHLAVAVEAALKDAGYDVQGIATSEAQALDLARSIHPNLAVIDVRLDPGNGKNVARELAARFNTTILMATSENPDSLHGIGASGLLPKPYDAADTPAALNAAQTLAEGARRVPLPDHMRKLWKGQMLRSSEAKTDSPTRPPDKPAALR